MITLLQILISLLGGIPLAMCIKRGVAAYVEKKPELAFAYLTLALAVVVAFATITTGLNAWR